MDVMRCSNIHALLHGAYAIAGCHIFPPTGALYRMVNSLHPLQAPGPKKAPSLDPFCVTGMLKSIYILLALLQSTRLSNTQHQ
jgi:hypothetical protein